MANRMRSNNGDQDFPTQSENQNYSEMYDQEFESDLADLIYTIINLEYFIEELRISIAENDKFCTWEAFSHIDQAGHGVINSNDLKLFFSNNHIAVHEHECEFLIYESTKKQKVITFQDFLRMILPRQDFNLGFRNSALLRKRLCGSQPQLPFYIEEQLAFLISKELEYLRTVENKKLDLLNRYKRDFRAAFDIITERQSDRIDKENMFQFMNKRYPQYQYDHYSYLVERFDRDKSRNLTIDEFCNAILPSDFIQRPPQPQKFTKNFDKLVYGDEMQFLQYVQKDTFEFGGRQSQQQQQQQSVQSQSKYEQQQFNQDQFDPENYKFQNNINYVRYNTSNSKNNSTVRKFLRTNMQFEKDFNVQNELQQYHRYVYDTTEGSQPQQTSQQPTQQSYQNDNYRQYIQQQPNYQPFDRIPEEHGTTGGLIPTSNYDRANTMPFNNQRQINPDYGRQAPQQEYQQSQPYYESQTSSLDPQNQQQ